MIDQDAYAQQCAATRRLHETVTHLAAERQTLVEELTAAISLVVLATGDRAEDDDTPPVFTTMTTITTTPGGGR